MTLPIVPRPRASISDLSTILLGFVSLGPCACGPQIAPGPVAAARAAAPPAWVDVAPTPGAPQAVAIAAFAGSSLDPSGQEGAACRLVADTPTRCGRDVVVATRTCGDDTIVSCAGSLAAAWLAAAPAPPDEARRWLSEGAFADASALAVELLDQSLYAGHPYGHAPAGRVGVLDAVTAGDVLALAARRRVRATTAAAGPSAAGPGVQDALSALPPRIVPSRPLISPLAPRGPRRRAVAAGPGAAVAAGAPTTALIDAEGAWLGLAAFAAAIERRTGADVAASWGDLVAPIDGLDLAGPRQSPRLAVVARGRLVGVPAAIDAAWEDLRAGRLDDGDVEAGRRALLTASAEPATRAASAAAHAALGLPDPAAADWARVSPARARAAMADPALPDALRFVLVHPEGTNIEDTVGPDVHGQDRFAPIPVPYEVFR